LALFGKSLAGKWKMWKMADEMVVCLCLSCFYITWYFVTLTGLSEGPVYVVKLNLEVPVESVAFRFTDQFTVIATGYVWSTRKLIGMY